MKKIRHFRDSDENVLKKKERESLMLGCIEDKGEDELYLEISIYWLEIFRNAFLESRGPIPFLVSLAKVINEPILWLMSKDDGVDVAWTNFCLERNVANEMCKPGEFYDQLAKIRFTHYYDETSSFLKKAMNVGHPFVRRWVSVPISSNGEFIGSLSAGSDKKVTFDRRHGMLLSMSAVILSCFGKDVLINTAHDFNF